MKRTRADIPRRGNIIGPCSVTAVPSSSPVPAAILRTWGLVDSPNRGPQARFTLDEVVTEAIRLADEDGVATLTLAGVGQGLGLATTALYRYVDSKDTLLELMADTALGPAPSLGSATSAERVHEWADALWQRYLAHPWLAVHPPQRAPRCPQAYAWLAALVSELRDLVDERPLAAAVTIDTLVRGYASQGLVAEDGEPDKAIVAEVARRHPGLRVGSGEAVEPLTDLHRALDRLIS